MPPGWPPTAPGSCVRTTPKASTRRSSPTPTAPTSEYVDRDGHLRTSDQYTDPRQVWADIAELPPAPVGAESLTVTRDGLAGLRELTRRVAASSQLSEWRSENLVIAVNELVTNSLRYGGGAASVSMWDDHGSVVFDVRDAGVISDPLVGCSRPSIHGTGGRGLWLVNQLCDLVQLHSSTGGTRIRVTV